MKKLDFDPDVTDTIRKTGAVRRLDYYLDETKPYVLDYLQTAFPSSDTAKDLHPAFFNIVKKIINLLSTVYTEPADRSLENGTDKDVAILDTLVDSMNLHGKMKVVNGYTNLLKTIFLKPTWRNGQMDLDIYTPDILDVETGEAYDDLQRVVITHYSDTDDYRDTFYTAWTPASFQKFNFKRELIHSEANPYQTIPFVVVRDAPAVHGFWNLGGNDLVNAQESIYQMLSDLLFTIKYQGFGVHILKQPQSNPHLVNYTADNLVIGPSSVVNLTDKDSDYKILSPKAPIKEVLEAIQFIYEMTALNNGLSAGHVSMKVNQQSGTSRQVASQELREMRRNQIPTYRRAETQLFELVRLIWNHNNPSNKLSDTGVFQINYPEIKLSNSNLTAEKRAEAWERELSMGVTSQVEILMDRDPDLSRDQAIAKLETLRTERKRYSDVNINENINGELSNE